MRWGGGVSQISFPRSRLSELERTIKRRKLPNGLTALHVPMPHTDQFFIGQMVRAGSRLEPADRYGVSHFLEHMMFRGSRLHPDFGKLAEAFESLGGDWNAATGHEHTEYWYSGIIHTAEEVTALFADFLESPRLNDIEVERSVIERELDGETNDHGHSIDLDYHIATLFWPGSTMAHPILGTRDTLAAMTVEKLRDYRDSHYAPGNMAVCVVGGDDSPQWMEMIARHFSDHRAALAGKARQPFPAVPSYVGPRAKWIEHSDNEYEIRLSFLVQGEWADDAQRYDLVSRMLADGFCARLTKRLREELGLVYDISAFTVLGHDFGTIDVSASCAQDELDQFLVELLALLRKFAAEGPSDDELRRIATRSLVDLELAPTHPEALATRLSWAAICGQAQSFAQERERIASAGVRDIRALSQQIFRREKAALAVLGPAGDHVEARINKILREGLP